MPFKEFDGELDQPKGYREFSGELDSPVGQQTGSTAEYDFSDPSGSDLGSAIMSAAKPAKQADPASQGGFMGELRQLRDEFFLGGTNLESSAKTLNAVAQNAQLEKRRQELDALVKAGRGESPEAMGVRKYIAAYEARLPKMVETAADASRLAQAAGRMTTRDSVRKLTEAKTFGAAIDAFKENPYETIAGLTASSALGQLPTLLTAAALGPVAGVAVAGLSSGVQELGSSINDYARDNKVDTTDPKALQAFLSNPEQLRGAIDYAGKRAGIIGLADGISGGLASKTMAPSIIKGTIARQAFNLPTQAVVQAGLGAGGEAGAQLASKGRIDEPGQVVAEAVGEFGGSPIEVAAFAREAADSAVRQDAKAIQDAVVASERQQNQANAAAAMSQIGAAQTVDQAIAAANVAVSTPVVGPLERQVKLDNDALLANAFAQAGITDEPAVAAPVVSADQVAAQGVESVPAEQQGVNVQAADAGQPQQAQPLSEPGKVWMGRRGDGYKSQADAMLALPSRQRANPELDWRVEPMQDGNFRLAGYAIGQEDANAQTDTNRIGNDAGPGASRGAASAVLYAQPVVRVEAGEGANAGQAVAARVPGLGEGQRSETAELRVDQAKADRAEAQSAIDRANAVNPLRNPNFTLGDPDPQAEAQLSEISSALPDVFGGQVVPVVGFASSEKGAPNGFKYKGRVYVNTRGLQVNAANTAWHETHHVLQAIAEADDGAGLKNTPAQKYRDSVDGLFADMSERGKLNYIGNFLMKSEVDADPEVKAFTDTLPKNITLRSVTQRSKLNELRDAAASKFLDDPILQKEMVADFVGNRATDRDFIIGLAKADPGGFSGFAKKWLSIIDGLIQSLRGNGKNKESAAVDAYLADLRKAKLVLRSAMIQLRRDGVMSDPSTQDSPDLSRREFVESPDDIGDLGAFNLDTYDFDKKPDDGMSLDDKNDLMNELVDQGFGVKGAVRRAPTDWKQVTDKDIKAAGVTPESAYGDVQLTENEFGNFTAPVLSGGVLRRIELQPYGMKEENLWTGFAGGLKIDKTWGYPLSIRGVDFESAQNFLTRMAAAADLVARKFDFAKTVNKATAERIADFWSQAANVPGATEFAQGTPELSGKSYEKLLQIAKMRVSKNDYRAVVSTAGDFFILDLMDVKTGQVSTGTIQIIGTPKSVGQQSVVFHTEKMVKGSGAGKAFYNIANSWAKAVGVKVLADNDGLTAVNSFRRTENAMSSAARDGGEMLIEPGWAQRVYGFDPKAKTPDAKRKNLTRIALAQLRNVLELAPDFDGIRYDLDTEMFVGADGKSAEAEVKTILARKEVRAYSMGRTSLIRAAITNELRQDEVALPDEIGSPILYSRSQDVVSDPRLEKWAASAMAGKYNPEPGFVVADQPPQALQMFGVGRSNPVVLQENMLRHLKNSDHLDITPRLIGQVPELLKSPRAVIEVNRQGVMTYDIILDANDAQGRPILLASRKDVMKSGRQSVGVTDIRTMYGKDESLAYVLRFIKGGNRVWLPQKEVDRVRDFTSREPISRTTQEGGAQPRTTEVDPLRRDRLEVSQSTAMVYSDRALVKSRQGGKEWTLLKEPLRVTQADVDRAQGIAFSAAQEDAGDLDTASQDIRYSVSQTNPGYTLDPESGWTRIRRAMQDYFIRMKQVQDAVKAQGGVVDESTDVYMAEELGYGRTQEQIKEFAEKAVRPLIEDAQRDGIDLDALALYAYAKHAPERNAAIAARNSRFPDGGSGMTDADAAAIVNKVKADGKEAEYEALRQRLMGMTQATRLIQHDEGLITDDEFQALQSAYQDYVPLRGFEQVDEDDKPTGRGTGKGWQVRGKENMRALGRGSRAGQIIENIIADYERAIVRSERNQIGKVFLNFVQTNPDPNLWEIDATKTKQAYDRQTGRVSRNTVIEKGDDTIGVKVNGREIFVKIKDRLLARAMREGWKDDYGATGRLITGGLGLFTSMLRNAYTRFNPEFAITNAARDFEFGTAAVLEALGEAGVARFAAHYAGAMRVGFKAETGRMETASPEWRRYFQEYRAAGGTTGGFYTKDIEEIQSDIRGMLLEGGTSPANLYERLRYNSATRLAGKALRVLEMAGATSEHAARVSAFRTAREMGKSPSQAASIAKNLTVNFNRRGELGQIFNGLYLFYNASIQGTARLAQMMKRPKMWAYMSGLTAGMVALAMRNAAAGGDDEDDGQTYWDKVPDHVKERNIVIMLPPGIDYEGAKKVGTRGRYVTIPMAYGLNVFPVIGNQIADVYRYSQDKTKGSSPLNAMIRVVSSLAGALNPLGGSLDNAHTAVMMVLPTFLDIPYQMVSGVNGFGRDVAPKKNDDDPTPDAYNSNIRQSGGPAERIAQWVNSTTGGDESEKGLIDVSPGTIENFVKTTTGGTGGFIYDVANLAGLGISNYRGESPDFTVKQIPVARRLYGEVDGDTNQGLFYERRASVMEAKRKEKLKGKFDKELSDPKEIAEAGLAKQASKITKLLSNNRKEIIEVRRSDESPMQRRMKERELKLERDELIDRFNESWMDAMKDLAKSQPNQ